MDEPGVHDRLVPHPDSCTAANPHRHSITWSARADMPGGTSKSRLRAVLRLITNSNLVACWMGKSAGLYPFRILSTRVAEPRQMCGKLTPYAARPPASQYS